MQRDIKEKVMRRWARRAKNPYSLRQSTYRHPEPVPGMKTAPSHVSIPDAAVKELRRLISDRKGETAAHKVLLKYPSLLPLLMEKITRSGTWYVSKPQICPPLIDGKKGKIPDFLLAGEDSYGLHWYLIELKSPTDLLFSRTGEAFSPAANKGLNQLARYQRYAEKHQGGLRDMLGIKDFVTPRGVLVIGNELETIDNKEKEQMKAFWNESIIDIDIMSYSRLLRSAEEVVREKKKYARHMSRK